MLESGIDPATVRFEVGVKIGNKCYCKYSIYLLENRSQFLTVPIETLLSFTLLKHHTVLRTLQDATLLFKARALVTITTKISAPGRLQKSDFRPPALLVYETHNEGRLGKNMSCYDSLMLNIPIIKHLFF